MFNSIHSCASNSFHTICLFTAIIFVAWCINEYSLDNDYPVIKFATFHETSKDLYPSITICDHDPYIREKYEPYFKNLPIIGKAADGSHQSKILGSYILLRRGDKGSALKEKDWLRKLNVTYDQWIDGLQQIDYDKITANFEDILTEFYFQIPIKFDHLDTLYYNMSNGSLIADETKIEKFANSSQWKGISLEAFKHLRTYVSDTGVHHKCITIDTPMVEGVAIREMGMKFDTSVFPERTISPGKFDFYLTYPKQFLRARINSGSRIKFPFDKPVNCYKFEIHVGYMRVFGRRYKKRSPCNIEWDNHDEIQMRHVAEKVGCAPKNWNISSDLPYCSIPNQFSEINEELNNKNGFMPPCRSIETLLKTTEGYTNWRMCLGKSFLELKLFLDEQSHYEEVVLLPAYSLQSLVGNSGK